MNRMTALLAIGMVLALGVCLFDGPDPAGEDVCSSVAAVTLAPALACSLGLIGTLRPPAAEAGVLFQADLPVPPPKV